MGKSICKSLPKIYKSEVLTYIKAKQCFGERKELQVGFNPLTGKVDSVQYIPIFETLKICWVRKGSLWWTLVLQVVKTCCATNQNMACQKNKNPVSLYIQSTICFKSQNFLADLKLPLCVVLTLSAKSNCVAI